METVDMSILREGLKELLKLKLANVERACKANDSIPIIDSFRQYKLSRTVAGRYISTERFDNIYNDFVSQFNRATQEVDV